MWEGIWEKGDLLGAGRETSSHAGGGAPPPSLHPSHPPAGRPLLLRSRPVSAAVARALLLLSTQGEERAGVGAAGRRGHMPGYGRSALLLCPKAVLACINISSMRQMFFQMQELPQLWRISRVDFVRNGIPPRLPPPISQHPQPLPWIDLPSHARLHFSLSSCLPPSNLLLLLPCPNLLSFPGASGLRALLHFFSGHKIQRADSGAAAWRVREQEKTPAFSSHISPTQPLFLSFPPYFRCLPCSLPSP